MGVTTPRTRPRASSQMGGGGPEGNVEHTGQGQQEGQDAPDDEARPGAAGLFGGAGAQDPGDQLRQGGGQQQAHADQVRGAGKDAAGHVGHADDRGQARGVDQKAQNAEDEHQNAGDFQQGPPCGIVLVIQNNTS